MYLFLFTYEKKIEYVRIFEHRIRMIRILELWLLFYIAKQYFALVYCVFINYNHSVDSNKAAAQITD